MRGAVETREDVRRAERRERRAKPTIGFPGSSLHVEKCSVEQHLRKVAQFGVHGAKGGTTGGQDVVAGGRYQRRAERMKRALVPNADTIDA